MILEEWADEWKIPADCLKDLRDRIFAASPEDRLRMGTTPKSEARVSQDVHIAASKAGVRLFRNNVGATPAKVAAKCPRCSHRFEVQLERPVRYGLANTSAAVNEKLKSSDFIGITPIVITQEMVGRRVGIFTAFECKRQGWQFKATKHELAQLAFIDLVLALGGIGAFIADADQLPFKATDSGVNNDD